MHLDDNPPPGDVERLLQECRPVPDRRFAAGLERRLFSRPRRARPALLHFHIRPLMAGGLLATAMASLALILSLAGLGPLALDGTLDVKGSSDCHYVMVQRRVMTPELVIDRNGRARIEQHPRQVERRVKRCR